MTATKKAAKAPKVEQEVLQGTPAPVRKGPVVIAKETVSSALNWVSERDVREVQLFTRSILRYGKMVIVAASILALIGLLDWWQWLSAVWATITVVALCWMEALRNRSYAKQFALREHSLSEVLRNEARREKESEL